MRFSEDKMASLRCSDGVERPIHIWQAPEPQQPRAVILAIHGGMAHAGDYVTPALTFRRHGIATVSFDMVGHDGKRKVDILPSTPSSTTKSSSSPGSRPRIRACRFLSWAIPWAA